MAAGKKKGFFPSFSIDDVKRTEQEFLVAYEAYADAIFRYCFFRLEDRERAKDVTQEAFTRAWNELVKGERIRNLRAFLYRIAYHLIVDETRRRRADSLEVLQAKGFEPATPDHQTMEQAAELALVSRLLNRLDGEERELILLRYVNGLPPREIADVLGVSANVLSLRLHRVLKKAKDLLTDV